MNASSFPSLLQHFFTDRLFGQLNASPHTVACYRDAFRLLFLFAKEHLGRSPSELRLEELDVPFLGKFLEYLELERHNCTRTRNNRLSALQAFFRYVSFSEPALALNCQRILAIPAKRYERCPGATHGRGHTSCTLRGFYRHLRQVYRLHSRVPGIRQGLRCRKNA